MADEDLSHRLLELLRRSEEGAPDASDRQAAMDYYLCRHRGDELPGQPAIQSSDVADMVHATLAQLQVFFTQDQVCYFQPDGADDEQPARAETDAVNRVMMESSRGYLEIGAAMHNALLMKAGILKVWCSTETETRRMRFEPGELPGLTADTISKLLPGEDSVDVEADQESGELIRTATVTQKRVQMQAVDPVNFRVSPRHDSLLLHDADMVAERHIWTRAEAVNDHGLSRQKVAQCPRYGSGTSADSGLRYKQGAEPASPADGWDLEEIEVWEVYARLDPRKGGRKPQLWRILFNEAGKVVLHRELANLVPYAAGSAIPQPHRFWGLSLYDRLKSVQDSKTTALRQWLVNLAVANLARTAVNDRVDTDDLLSGRAVGVVRVDGAGPVGDALMPFPHVDTGASAATFMQYMDAARAERGGASLELQTGEAQLLGHSVGSQGLDRAYSVQEQMAAWYARNLAETLLRSAFLLVHRTLIQEYDRPLSVPMADQWVQVDPRQWAERVRVDIRGGLSFGERMRKQAALQQVVQTIMAAMGAGVDGVLADLQGLYTALLDWCQASGLDGSERYFVNPAGQKAAQAAQAKQQQAEQQQAMQQQLWQIHLQLEQTRIALQEQKQQTDALQQRADLAFKYRELATHAEIEEAKLTGSIHGDLLRAQSAARAAAARADTGIGAVAAEED
jgi:hypothetical protein